MKTNRLLSCALALAVTVSALALPASAATAFPDIQSHWAKSYIEEMTDANMFKGYEDGTFKPENKLTTAEALALCARAVGLDENTSAEIADDYKEAVDDVLDDSQSWFYREFAICLAAGILTESDLKSLTQSGALTKPIVKEDLAVYLIRAMQLGPMSERLSSYPMSFDDTASISESAKPSVYLLSVYGIVQGDQNNDFGPDGQVTRAIMATMLSRAIRYMDAHGTDPDLPEYTSYAFQQGVIAATPAEGSGGALILTLNDDLTGATAYSVSLPSGVTIYENNMESTTSALKAGRHARVCLDGRGTAYAVRVSDALEEFEATVNGIDGYDIAITRSGQGEILTMDRFTQVQVGSKTTGDRSIVDADAGYTSAVCKLDDQGHLVAIRLDGGTRTEEGILAGYTKASGTTAASIQVIGFDGVTRTFSVPSGATTTVNSLVSNLNSSYEGDYVSLRVSNDSNAVVTAAVDTVTEYVQGAVKATSYASDVNTITVTNLDTGKATSYDVSKSAVITYNGETTLLRNIKKDYFVTLRLSGGDAALIEAYPGSTVTEGVITERIFSDTDTTVTFVVTQEDDTQVSFKVDLSNPPDIERDEADSTIDKLRTGDSVEVTVRYNEVTRITATSQSANVIGTVDRIIQEKNGYTLEMTLSDGEEVSYTVTSGVSVTQSGKSVNLSSLRPGYKLGLVVSGEQVVSIEIQQAVNSSNKLTGTVIYVSASDKYIYLRCVDEAGNEEIVTVNAPSGTVILDVSTGDSLSLKYLEAGDIIEANGAYDGAEFDATVILRQ